MKTHEEYLAKHLTDNGVNIEQLPLGSVRILGDLAEVMQQMVDSKVIERQDPHCWFPVTKKEAEEDFGDCNEEGNYLIIVVLMRTEFSAIVYKDGLIELV